LLLLLRKQGVQPFPELTVRLTPTRYLVPDVAVAGADFPGPYPIEPVLLWGVPYCWIFDPVKRTAWEYHAGGEPVRAHGVARAGDIAVDLAELFSSLDS